MSTHQDPHDERFEGLEAIDVLLGQGTPAELAKAREERARDPLAAVEFAETRQLLEAMRGLRVEPSDRLRRGLDSVVRECARRQSRRRPTPAHGWRGCRVPMSRQRGLRPACRGARPRSSTTTPAPS